ncbi:MAG TPA: acyl-CoA dehydrogenase family protein [Candidatus Binataceae bacterium]|jgi:alkylation response protein AidB-like acyl-CoA dehydrogenase|nr:acyl-CoA dehydrogenase family protein [Candidatus Binataceae bacterium]
MSTDEARLEPRRRIRFAFSDEQEQFRSALRRFLKDRSPTTEIRRLMATAEGYDPAVWRQMSQDLALPGIHVPQPYGGAGFGMVELCIVTEEMGRALLCAPYFSTAVLAANAIMNAGSEAQKSKLLPAVANGTRLATLAITEPDGNWDPDSIRTVATREAGGYRIDGAKSYVVDGHLADLLVVAARLAGSSGSEGLALFTLAADAGGVERRLLESMDPTRKIARVEFRGARAGLLGGLGEGAASIVRTLDQAAIALANEMMGGAQTMLDSAVSYAKLRVQFGRTIGSFQAIKHKLADMLLDVELGKSAAYYAAQAAALDDPEWPALASLAKAAASETYLHTAAECIQIHGGIGFTWDNDTHLWFKRAKSSEVFLGQPSYHRELLMRRWGV